MTIPSEWLEHIVFIVHAVLWNAFVVLALLNPWAKYLSIAPADKKGFSTYKWIHWEEVTP